uniref:C2 calcium dependent domain containing 2 n=1 Tax=Labrus bergylta TaxID=56723 RepID=A0A3Q3FAT2_9LABR
MSDLESSYFGLEDPQWLCMVTLFLASVVTLLLYFIQYFQHRRVGDERGAGEDNEAASLLGWALSLRSWKSQWRGVWCRALNQESRKRGVSLMTTMNSVSCGSQAASCSVVGEQLQFSVSAASSSMSPTNPRRYTVCVSPLELQVNALQSTFIYFYFLFFQQAAHNNVVSPPKPPRAHDWKLLVKNIRVTLNQEDDAAGSMNPLCVLKLDDPPQKFNTSVLKNTTNPAWDQPFIFELNGLSKELNIQLMNDGQPQENSLLGQVSVPFDLVKKHPKGQQTFALMTKDTVTGSLTTDFTFLEPSEVRSWHPPTPASNKRVEMDRTVMPCGTVVTTITAVKSKPGRPLPPGLTIASKVLSQPCVLGLTVNKALSSSDTELLMLNGTDPVAEAAIRQLHQSAKQKLKSPVKKSTIIISGIAKTPLSQDDELALMAGYAAAMDASMSEGSSTQDVTTAIATGASSPPDESEPQEGPSGIGRPPDDWESQTGETLDHTSLSMCVSEASLTLPTEPQPPRKVFCSFLQKSAKLFFRRRHQRKEPGMSQSHNDLVYLESPAAVERASRTATISRMLSRKSKNKSKANGSTSTGEPHE